MTDRVSKVLAPVHVILLAGLATSLLAQSGSENPPTPQNLRRADVAGSDYAFYPGDYSHAGVIGNSLPGTWRPFETTSPWNTPIPTGAPTHPDSAGIMAGVTATMGNVRLSRSYTIPVWVVNGDNLTPVRVRSDYIFDFWDTDRDGWSDIGIPLTPEMWAEGTSDGHICIVDPFRRMAYEMSKFSRLDDGTPTCTTFNVWATDGRGHGDPNEGRRWQVRGGRGSGFALIAGLIRPEELTAGEIRHALAFSYPTNRMADDGSNIFLLPPACRSDGRYAGASYPIEGMRFQLDPAATEADFTAWGLNREGKIVARALQKYGMFVGDNGGAMVIYAQLLRPTGDENVAEWERLFPGIFHNIERIPTSRLRVVYTGAPTTK